MSASVATHVTDHAAVAPAAATAPPRGRLEAIDALRGLVVVLMILDHARDYAVPAIKVTDPMTLDATPALVYWMRWVTHFCAPIFTCLAGVSAGLQDDGGDAADRRRYLVVRGLVLVLLEFTVVWFSWTFSLVWPLLYAQVIWGIGVALVVLGLAQSLPRTLRFALGVAIVAGHNLLDGWHPTSPAPLHWLWAVLHDRQVMPLVGDLSVRTSYPVLPMIGLVLAGEGIGRWFRRTPASPARARTLAWAGAAMLALFVVLRTLVPYGDPTPADLAGSTGRDVLAVLNATKYPMSFAFILMTLGPAALLLAAWDGGVPRLARPLVRLGSVPMFLYIAHLYVLHVLGIGWALATGHAWAAFDFRARITGIPAGAGWALPTTFLVVAATVALLWPAAGWYARVRASKRWAITRYI